MHTLLQMKIAATTKEDDKSLCWVLEKARERGMKFRNDRIPFIVENIKYMGQFFSKNGLHTYDSKVDAINKRPPTKGKKGLQKSRHYPISGPTHSKMTSYGYGKLGNRKP